MFNEYHFIVTISDMIDNDHKARNCIIRSDREFFAWLQCVMDTLKNLNAHETIYKIELIEVE